MEVSRYGVTCTNTASQADTNVGHLSNYLGLSVLIKGISGGAPEGL